MHILIHKAAIDYQIKELIARVCLFMLVLCMIYTQIFYDKPTDWLWIAESLGLLVMLYYGGRMYHKSRQKLSDAIERSLKIEMK